MTSPTLARRLLCFVAEQTAERRGPLDLTTLIGIIACFALLVLAIITRDGAQVFISVPSLMIVLGGTIGAVLITYPANIVFKVFAVVRNAFLGRTPDNTQIITLFGQLARKARREGLLSLQAAETDLEDDFYRKGLALVVDGREADIVQSILTAEIDATIDRHQVGAEVFEKLGMYSPAFGMLGTIIGLIQMLQSMDDPSTIGPAMAIALVTTFYGSLLANVVFIPLAGKLKMRSKEEVFRKEMLIEGFLGLLSGDDPHVMSEKLASLLRPADRPAGELGV